jgi:ADP-ribosylation factor-like protein 13B
MFTLMGNCVAHCKQKGEKKATFVVCGLDNAGKTTITKALQGKIERETRPTVGVRFDNKWEAGKFKLEVFDLGGGAKIRKIWDSYYAEVHGAIYVIDSADEARLAESKECLAAMVADPHLAGKPLLVFANKQVRTASGCL